MQTVVRECGGWWVVGGRWRATGPHALLHCLACYDKEHTFSCTGTERPSILPLSQPLVPGMQEAARSGLPCGPFSGCCCCCCLFIFTVFNTREIPGRAVVLWTYAPCNATTTHETQKATAHTLASCLTIRTIPVPSD